MLLSPSAIRAELAALVRLGAPIAVTQLGFMTMGVVDTMLAGPLGADALAALALGNTVFFSVLLGGMGVLMSLDSWVSQAFGRGDLDRAAEGLSQGLWLALLLSPLAAATVLLAPPLLAVSGYDPVMVSGARAYLGPLTWGMAPALLFQAYRSFLNAVNVTRPLMWVAIGANVLNYLLDQWFIHGGWGLEPLGVTGIAWSTTLCRFALWLPAALIVHRAGHFAGWPRFLRRPQAAALTRLLRVGVPTGLQLLAEMAAFAGTTMLMGLLGPVPLASHQVALNILALIFMVPLSLGQAGSVRAGQALGRRDLDGVAVAGWTAWGVAFAFTGLAAVLFLTAAEPIVRLYRPPQEVVELATSLLFVAIFMLPGDHAQTVGFGVLRGLGDTRLPLFVVVAGYTVGMGYGVVRTFALDGGPEQLWWGLAVGVWTVAIGLMLRFALLLRGLRRGAT